MIQIFDKKFFSGTFLEKMYQKNSILKKTRSFSWKIPIFQEKSNEMIQIFLKSKKSGTFIFTALSTQRLTQRLTQRSFPTCPKMCRRSECRLQVPLSITRTVVDHKNRSGMVINQMNYYVEVNRSILMCKVYFTIWIVNREVAFLFNNNKMTPSCSTLV